ncbi:hypothetical protein COO91_06279 [Nostoc flagelliforme CCNUN1]|uniref:Uncharacterized protein n=1 Tax=Nostoc flagelliforme CCNUN1 TaxID=2038116 RepID=A0A2K8SY18_9NOSO|nr:hypothetical protein COO91_06279 [Nostoc flagelliforme CCNUN1]
MNQIAKKIMVRTSLLVIVLSTFTLTTQKLHFLKDSGVINVR